MVDGEVLGFGFLVASEWGEVLGFVAVGVDFMGFGGWWVMGLVWVSLFLSFFFSFYFFFIFLFGTGKHDWMETFLDQVEKWQRQLSGGENTMERGFFFFFFFVVIFSSFGFTVGCCNILVFALIPKLMQDNQNKIEITEK